MPETSPGRARTDVADFWDRAIAVWLSGRRDQRDPLGRWMDSYTPDEGASFEAEYYPEPFVGDLRGLHREPRLVVLGAGPGVGHARAQARDGVWAERVAAVGYSHCFERSPLGDPATWSELSIRPSRHWDGLVRFARRWLNDPSAAADDVLEMYLYPWHTRSLSGSLEPPRDIIDAFVWQPIAEIGVAHVFAFDDRWSSLASGLGLPVLARWGAEGGQLSGGGAGGGWRCRVYGLPSGQQLVVSSQTAFQGPPGPDRLPVLRRILARDDAVPEVEAVQRLSAS